MEALVGRVVADGETLYANQGKLAQKGTIFYRVVWTNYPADMVWFEPKSNLGVGLIDEFESHIAAEEAAEAREELEERELIQLEAMASADHST